MLAPQTQYPPTPSIMAFTRDLAALKIRGREETLNEHLIKLLAVDAPETTRTVWKKEIGRHLRFLPKLRLKPRASLISAASWLEWLYNEPFVGSEVGYTQAHIDNSRDLDLVWNDIPAEDIHRVLAAFHVALSRELAEGRPGLELIPV